MVYLSFTDFRRKLFQKAKLIYNSSKLPWVIIGLGIILRLAQYLYNRLLWLDEASLALNIVNKSFSELLLLPLKPFQVASPGFLAVEKLSIYIFGNSEYALRLFPLLAGIASLFIFYKLIKIFLRPKAVPIALGLFAISNSLIYYSSELKQYSSDVALTLLLILATFHLQLKKITIPRTILFGGIGAIVVWFSHPAVFVLAGIAVSSILFCLKEKDWSKIMRVSIGHAIWVTSFIVHYFACLNNLVDDSRLLNFWESGFMPLPPLSFWDIKWFIDKFFNIFQDPLGITLYGIAGLSFLVGCFYMFREKRKVFFLLVSPIFFTLLGSGLHKYPFAGRLILFISPILIMIIAEGIEEIRYKTSNNFSIIGILLIGLLFFHPLFKASYHLIRPRTNEEIKPVIEYVKEHKQKKDILYLYYGSINAFKYYSKK